MRLISILLLTLCSAASSFGAVVTTTLNLTGGAGRNKNTQATINSTENVLQINVEDGAGRPRTVTMYSPDTDWILRTTTGDSTTDAKIAKGQTVTEEYAVSTTLYFLRQSADGTLVVIPVK